MSFLREVLKLKTHKIPTLIGLESSRNYAKATTVTNVTGAATKKKKVGKLGPMVEKKVLSVETDAEKLVKFVCGSNVMKTGQDVEIKPDSEYPDWLWGLRTGPPLPLDQVDPTTKEYWLRVRKLGMMRNNQLSKLRKF